MQQLVIAAVSLVIGMRAENFAVLSLQFIVASIEQFLELFNSVCLGYGFQGYLVSLLVADVRSGLFGFGNRVETVK